MSVVLVNGDGNPAVHASQDADLLGGIGGQETGILDINDKFAATIADANTVEISSGVCITKEGRRIQIDVGDVEEIVVPTGSQGTTKYYIIGFHLYTDGSGNQLAETFIDEVASPSATITEKMFKDGETEVYVSLYRITRNGLNLEGLTLMLPEIGSLAGGGIIGNTDISGIADGTVTGAIAQINTDLSDLFKATLIGEFTSSSQSQTIAKTDYKEINILLRKIESDARIEAWDERTVNVDAMLKRFSASGKSKYVVQLSRYGGSNIYVYGAIVLELSGNNIVISGYTIAQSVWSSDGISVYGIK